MLNFEANQMQEKKRLLIGELYEKFWKELYTVAFRRLNSAEEVEDILHDIFISLFAADINLDHIESARALLHQRLKSRIINFHRKQFMVVAFREQEALKSELDEADSETRLMSRELEQVVQQEIDRMPEKMKEIFLLSRNEQLSSEEIASQLQLSNQTVRNQISNAIKRIRAAVSVYGNEELSASALNILVTISVLLLTNH